MRYFTSVLPVSQTLRLGYLLAINLYCTLKTDFWVFLWEGALGVAVCRFSDYSEPAVRSIEKELIEPPQVQLSSPALA